MMDQESGLLRGMFSTKPSTETIQTCQLDPYERFSVKLIKTKFSVKKMHLEM